MFRLSPWCSLWSYSRNSTMIVLAILSCKSDQHQFTRNYTDCSQPHLAQTATCLYGNEVGRGQYEIRDDVAQCSDTPGQIVSIDGHQTVRSEHSQKTIFLRCLFQGGALSVCIKHNNCQVIMSYEDCQNNLKQLKNIFTGEANKEAQSWECQKQSSVESN